MVYRSSWFPRSIVSCATEGIQYLLAEGNLRRTIGFVITFSVFLLGCVDYSVIRQSHRLSDVVVPRCVSR